MEILFSRKGCGECEDFRLKKLLDQHPIQQESLDDSEGLMLATFYMMLVKGSYVTPSLYTGEDKLCGDGGKKFFGGEEVIKYLTGGIRNG